MEDEDAPEPVLKSPVVTKPAITSIPATDDNDLGMEIEQTIEEEEESAQIEESCLLRIIRSWSWDFQLATNLEFEDAKAEPATKAPDLGARRRPYGGSEVGPERQYE